MIGTSAPGIDIVDATAAHARYVADRLRAGDALEITLLDERPRGAVWHTWRGSVVRRAVLLDGAPAAIWGVYGGLLDEVGIPWLMTTPEIERIPFTLVRRARAEVAEMLTLYPRLENYVLASYVKAVKYIGLLGFRLDDPAPLGAAQVMFRRFSMVAAAAETVLAEVA